MVREAANWGNKCPTNLVEVQPCEEEDCKVDGGWSGWSRCNNISKNSQKYFQVLLFQVGLLLRVVRPRLPEPESELQRARAPARRGAVPGAAAGDQGGVVSSLLDIIIHDLLNVATKFCGKGAN